MDDPPESIEDAIELLDDMRGRSISTLTAARQIAEPFGVEISDVHDYVKTAEQRMSEERALINSDPDELCIGIFQLSKLLVDETTDESGNISGPYLGTGKNCDHAHEKNVETLKAAHLEG